MGATVYCLCDQKGGCAKTVISVNLGIGLAREGRRVFLVDVDSQGSMTASLGCQQPDQMEITLSDVLDGILQDKPLPPGSGILHHEEGVDLLPANIGLFSLEVTLVNPLHQRQYKPDRPPFKRDEKPLRCLNLPQQCGKAVLPYSTISSLTAPT